MDVFEIEPQPGEPVLKLKTTPLYEWFDETYTEYPKGHEQLPRLEEQSQQMERELEDLPLLPFAYRDDRERAIEMVNSNNRLVAVPPGDPLSQKQEKLLGDGYNLTWHHYLLPREFRKRGVPEGSIVEFLGTEEERYKEQYLLELQPPYETWVEWEIRRRAEEAAARGKWEQAAAWEQNKSTR